jgi:hypothetical protein
MITSVGEVGKGHFRTSKPAAGVVDLMEALRRSGGQAPTKLKKAAG